MPVYVKDVIVGKVPERAMTSGKIENDWTVVDSSFQFHFSLFSNDFVIVKTSKGEEIAGYYKGSDRATCSITLLSHDGSELFRGIGVKTLKKFEKYYVDMLGEKFLIKQEKAPYGMANRSNKLPRKAFRSQGTASTRDT